MSQDDIVESMARTLWVSAYSSYADENPRKRGVVHARGGQSWHDVAPETPAAADRAADELAELFKTKNNASLEQLAQRARVADGKKIDEEDFGYCLAMMAMDEGVGWWDDHERFDLKVPRFEVMYDGRSLEWSGEAITVQHRLPGMNPAGGELRYIDVHKERRGWHVDAKYPSRTTTNYGPFKTKERAMRMREAVIESDLQRNAPGDERFPHPPYVVRHRKDGHYWVGLENIARVGQGWSSNLDDAKRLTSAEARAWWAGMHPDSDVVPLNASPRPNARSLLAGPRWDTARQKLAGAAAGTRKNPPKLGQKYVLGTWAPRSRVQLGEWRFPPARRSKIVTHRDDPGGTREGGTFMPGEWVTVIRNGANVGHTVTVKIDRTGAIEEKDALTPLFEVDPVRSIKA